MCREKREFYGKGIYKSYGGRKMWKRGRKRSCVCKYSVKDSVNIVQKGRKKM